LIYDLDEFDGDELLMSLFIFVIFFCGFSDHPFCFFVDGM